MISPLPLFISLSTQTENIFPSESKKRMGLNDSINIEIIDRDYNLPADIFTITGLTENFQYLDLDTVKEVLLSSKKYSAKEVNEEIVALSKLSGYKNASKRNKRRT